MSAAEETRTRISPRHLAVRALVALALVVDAVVHLRLAPGYQLSAPAGIGAGNLFRLESVVALAAAVFVLVRGTLIAYAVAFLVALSALAAVLLYRYVDVPAFGPFPAMYEPVWFPEKTLSAVAEAVAVVVAGAALWWTARSHRATSTPSGTDKAVTLP